MKRMIKNTSEYRNFRNEMYILYQRGCKKIYLYKEFVNELKREYGIPENTKCTFFGMEIYEV